MITFLLGGISCPRSARTGPGGKQQGENEPFADEALRFTRSQALQRDVQIEVETMDKAGGFIGYMFVPNEKGGHTNLAELLLEEGLASLHFTADRSRYYNQLVAAEDSAKRARHNLWKDYVETSAEQLAEEAKANDVAERKLNLRRIAVSEVCSGNLHIAAQNYSDGDTIEKLMSTLQREVTPSSSFTPRRNEICVCMFHEVNLWHRARIESIKGGRADVLYIDFGNRENVATSDLAPLPPSLVSQTPLCHEYKLAFVQLPNDKDFAAETEAALREICFGATEIQMNVEYKVANIEAVSLFSPSSSGEQLDIGKQLVTDGLALTEARRENRFKALMNEYQEAEKTARTERRNIWRYGDFTGSEF